MKQFDMPSPSEMHQERLPVIQLPLQPSAVVRHRHTPSVSSMHPVPTEAIADLPDLRPSSKTAVGGAPETYVNPLTWLSRIYAKARRQEHLHYHSHGGHHHHHPHLHHHTTTAHSHYCKHHPSGHSPLQPLSLQQPYQQSQHRYPTRSKAARARQLGENVLAGQNTNFSCAQCCAPSKHQSLKEQLFAKATVVTLEPKYSTVNWAAEFYCTVTSPFFALPLSLYLDSGFRWSAPDAHLMHFTIWLSVLTALTSSTYHATLYKLFSSLDACLATIMFYLNTMHLMRSMPEPYRKMTRAAMVVPDPLADWLSWDLMPYFISIILATLFLLSWQKTAKLSMLLMIPMIPATIWGFVAHESWIGLVCGVTGLVMFAADRFHLFCGHSWWHLAGGISLYCGIRAAAIGSQTM